MKRSFLAGGIVVTAICLAASFTHEKKVKPSSIVLGASYSNYIDTPPPKRDTSKLPWPDTTKRPTPPGN